MIKNYYVVPGSCEDCTLKDPCKINKIEVKRFLNMLKLEKCGDNKKIIVIITAS